MFPLNSTQRSAFDGLRREFEQSIGVPQEMPRGVAVFDTDSALVVELDMPGVMKSDIELVLEKDVLRIRAERKSPEIDAQHQQDFRTYGQLEHVFRLGFAVDPSGLDAVCDNGVLRVTLPKAAGEQPKRISVRNSSDNNGSEHNA